MQWCAETLHATFFCLRTCGCGATDTKWRSSCHECHLNECLRARRPVSVAKLTPQSKKSWIRNKSQFQCINLLKLRDILFIRQKSSIFVVCVHLRETSRAPCWNGQTNPGFLACGVEQTILNDGQDKHSLCWQTDPSFSISCSTCTPQVVLTQNIKSSFSTHSFSSPDWWTLQSDTHGDPRTYVNPCASFRNAASFLNAVTNALNLSQKNFLEINRHFQKTGAETRYSCQP